MLVLMLPVLPPSLWLHVWFDEVKSSLVPCSEGTVRELTKERTLNFYAGGISPYSSLNGPAVQLVANAWQRNAISGV